MLQLSPLSLAPNRTIHDTLWSLALSPPNAVAPIHRRRIAASFLCRPRDTAPLVMLLLLVLTPASFPNIRHRCASSSLCCHQEVPLATLPCLGFRRCPCRTLSPRRTLSRYSAPVRSLLPEQATCCCWCHCHCCYCSCRCHLCWLFHTEQPAKCHGFWRGPRRTMSRRSAVG